MHDVRVLKFLAVLMLGLSAFTNVSAITLAELNRQCKDALNQASLKDATLQCTQAYEMAKSLSQSPLDQKQLAYESYAELKLAEENHIEAEAVYKAIIDMVEKRPGSQPLVLAGLYDKLANSMVARGGAASATGLINKSLALREQYAGRESVLVADSLHTLGMSHLALGHYEEAIQAFLRELELKKKDAATGDLQIGRTLTSLGVAVLSGRGAEQAEPFVREAYNRMSTQLDRSNFQLLETVELFAKISSMTGKLQDAEILLRQGLLIRETALGAGHPSLAGLHNELGLLYLRYGASAEAAVQLRKALDIRSKLFGMNDLRVAELTNNLGVVLYQSGRVDEALPMLQHAASVTYVALGAEHPVTRERWNNLQRAMNASKP